MLTVVSSFGEACTESSLGASVLSNKKTPFTRGIFILGLFTSNMDRETHGRMGRFHQCF